MSASSPQPAVDAVIVNFNAGDALLRCIGSVLAQQPTNTVTLIDNASTDGSARRAADRFAGDGRFEMILEGHNPGFAAAVNRAVERVAGRASGDYLLILNPDCELEPGSLAELVTALENDRGSALAGPLVTDPDGRPQRANLRRFPGPWNSLVSFSGLWRLEPWLPAFRGVEPARGLPEDRTPADAVSGACMLVRKSAFHAIGGLDAAYRLHCEDLDLMYRLHQAGSRCLFVPQARVVHLQGLSSRSRPLWVHWQKHRGMQRFFAKFQVPRYPALLRLPLGLAVLGGIWLHFLVTLPPALLRR